MSSAISPKSFEPSAFQTKETGLSLYMSAELKSKSVISFLNSFEDVSGMTCLLASMTRVVPVPADRQKDRDGN